MYLIYGFCNDLCRRCNTKGQKTAYWIAEGEQHPALGFDCINSVIYHPLFKLQSSNYALRILAHSWSKTLVKSTKANVAWSY